MSHHTLIITHNIPALFVYILLIENDFFFWTGNSWRLDANQNDKDKFPNILFSSESLIHIISSQRRTISSVKENYIFLFGEILLHIFMYKYINPTVYQSILCAFITSFYFVSSKGTIHTLRTLKITKFRTPPLPPTPKCLKKFWKINGTYAFGSPVERP